MIAKILRYLMKKGPAKAAKEVVEEVPAKAAQYGEDLEKFFEGIKKVNPDLGKKPSTVEKLKQTYSGAVETLKTENPSARKKLKERLDNMNRIMQEEDERIKREALEEMDREKERRKGKFAAPTLILDGDK